VPIPSTPEGETRVVFYASVPGWGWGCLQHQMRSSWVTAVVARVVGGAGGCFEGG
jgi:hypothetical protein